MKKLISVLLVACMIFSFSSCKGDDKKPKEEDYVLPTQIIDADISLPYTNSDSFNPYEAKSNFNRDLIPVIYESLFVATDDGKGLPQLASNGEIDGRTVTVRLLSGVVFSDGAVLTADHVKESFEKAKNNSFYIPNLSNISSVEVKDKYTLVFNLYNPDEMVLNVLSFPVVRNDKGRCFGSGKYSIEYLEDIPYLQVNVKHRDFSTDWNKQIALYNMAGVSSPIYPFKANEISVYKNDLSSGKYNNLSSVTMVEEMNNLVYIGVNSVWAGSSTSNQWLRRAINIGIDRTAIVRESFLGQGTPTSTMFKPDFYPGADVVTDMRGDPEKAIRIMENNGYDSVNAEGFRTNGSNVLSVSILVCSRNKYKVDVANALKNALEELGIRASVSERETLSAFKKALSNETFGLYIGETQMTDNCDMSEFFTSSGDLNYGVDDDFYSRYQNYKGGKIDTEKFVKALNVYSPVIPLFYRKSVVFVNPNISGIDETKPLYSGVCNWKMAEENT